MRGETGVLTIVLSKSSITNQLPLPEDLDWSAVDTYEWSHHAEKKRMLERNISIYEVLATMERPAYVTSSRTDESARVYWRGDIKVVYNPWQNKIITVISVNGDHIPRQALYPIPRQATPANAEEPMARVRLIKHDTTRECWNAYVAEYGPDHEFTTKEFKSAHDHCDHNDSALQQQLSAAKTRGEVINSTNSPDLAFGRWRIAHPVQTHTIPQQAAEEFTPEPEEATMQPMMIQEARASAALDGETQSLGPVIEVPVTDDNPIPKVVPAAAALMPLKHTPEQVIRHHLNQLTAALNEYDAEWTVNLSRDEVMLSIRWNK